jgi:hypothetical protein
LVLKEVLPVREDPVTLRAFKSTLSRVGQLVLAEVHVLAEGLSALVTFKGALAWAGLVLQDGSAGPGLPRLAAFIVDSLMTDELCTLAEGFPTLMALEGLHPGVNPLVLR